MIISKVTKTLFLANIQGDILVLLEKDFFFKIGILEWCDKMNKITFQFQIIVF